MGTGILSTGESKFVCHRTCVQYKQVPDLQVLQILGFIAKPQFLLNPDRKTRENQGRGFILAN